MSMCDEYRPCRHCGELTDTGCCSDACADALDAEVTFQRRLAAGEIDDDGNELGDWCCYCGSWFSYKVCGESSIYCDDPTCLINAQSEGAY
jgi:hypothetical protein